jgi:hypothetical protein
VRMLLRWVQGTPRTARTEAQVKCKSKMSHYLTDTFWRCVRVAGHRGMCRGSWGRHPYRWFYVKPARKPGERGRGK